MTTKRRQQIIAAAVALLESGLLPSVLPGRLMAEFGVTPAQARRLAGAALREHKKARAG